MHDDTPSRRTFSMVILFLAAIGAFVVFGWVYRLALGALGLLAKFVFGFGGLLVLGLLIFFMARRISKG